MHYIPIGRVGVKYKYLLHFYTNINTFYQIQIQNTNITHIKY